MPETGVVAALLREIKSKAASFGDNKMPASDPSEHGKFVIHVEGCAKATGQRPSVRLHAALDDDPDFLPLPLAQKQSVLKTGNCTTCNECPKESREVTASEQQISADFRSTYSMSMLNGRPATEIVNKLQIVGQLFCDLRGKEIVIGISSYVIRVCFATEGHCFWIPTSQYEEIIAYPLVKRGEKGKAFQIPSSLVNGPDRSTPLLITIAAAFIRPKWTLIFVDHQCFMTFHVMRLRRPCISTDFKPDAPLWPRFWSKEHGPVHSTEPYNNERVLDQFRKEIVSGDDFKLKPIYSVMRQRQDVFNGFGAQEACDTLFAALIHPLMPTFFICQNNNLWCRFRQTVIAQHHLRVERVLSPERLNAVPLPYTSGPRPFRFNTNGHKLYSAGITCYRKEEVKLSAEQLARAHSMCLFNKDAVLGEDGIARVQQVSLQPASNQLKDVRLEPATWKNCSNVVVTNYLHRVSNSDQSESLSNVYSPFLCQIPKTWPGYNNMWKGVIDFTKSVNESTLGPYSFKVFVDAAWTKKHMISDPVGRRPVQQVGTGKSKRPKKQDIPSGKSRMSQKSQLVHIGMSGSGGVGTNTLDVDDTEKSLEDGAISRRQLRSYSRREMDNLKPY